MSASEHAVSTRDQSPEGTQAVTSQGGKQEVTGSGERTVPGRFYRPATDIHETDDALTVVMDMPGVSRDRVEIRLERDVLTVEGHIDSEAYRELTPVYAEYNLGHFSRSFVLSSEIDQEKIAAGMVDGVLTLRLPKLSERRTRRIQVS